MFYLFFLFTHSALISYLKGSAVKISPSQFPDLYKQLEFCCRKLNITEIPETFILHADGAFNAFATRFLGRNFVVLFSDVVDALNDNKNALNFYIGHELGHIHRSHLLWAPVLFPAMLFPLLGAAYSRAREYTCDNYGYVCCPSPQDAIHGLAALSAGAKRWKDLNIQSYVSQSEVTGGFWMSFNELIADYPWLVKRMARIVAMSKHQSFTPPSRSFFAWVFALLVPRTGIGAGAGAMLSLVLVAVAIIGILAAIAIPQFEAYRQMAMENMEPDTEVYEIAPDDEQYSTPESWYELE
jgi:Zn-dependent protease with chaperone function